VIRTKVTWKTIKTATKLYKPAA